MKYIIWILAGAVIILGVSQWRSCSDKTAANLQTEKQVIQHQRDSIALVHARVIASDSILKEKYKADTAKYREVIDSLKSAYKASQIKYLDIKKQLSQTVADLSGLVNTGSDSALISELAKLKEQLSGADEVVQFLQTNSSERDSLMSAEIVFRDSIIQAKDRTIENLKSNYAGLQILLDRANADLDTAIRQLQKGKKINVLRTVAEVALLIGLIFKK